MRFQTVLFTPGDRIDRVRKAWKNAAADVVVADLEDAVAPDGKDAARDAVAGLLREVPAADCLRAVRINPGARGEADIDALAPLRPDLFVVPKAESAKDLEAIAMRIAMAQEDMDGTPLLAILESPRGVLAAQAVCQVPAVAAVAFGAEDLAAEAGMRRTPGNAEVAVARGLVALAAAAEGVAAIDMITADYRDDDRTRREAVEARDLGYAGKMCLHPAQVAVVREAFRSTDDELAWARDVLAAVDAAGAGEGGVVVVAGRMIDRPLVRQARRILGGA